MRGLKKVSNRRTDALARTGWVEVEHMLAEHYRRAGFVVDHVGTGASGERFDGGIDLKLRRNDEYIVVQCKHWNALKVPHNDVHQLIGLMVNEGATGAILVTSGEFTRAAIEAATRQGHVHLVDGDDLRDMLGPLPEPEAPSRWVAVSESDLGRHATSLSRHVGERLLDAAEDRIRKGPRGRSMGVTAIGTVIRAALIKGVLSLIFLIAIVLLFNYFVRATVKNLQNDLTPTSRQSGHAITPVQESIPPVTRPERARIRIIQQPTPEEIRESQRKADEAMKVLEATTPEV